MTLPAYPASRGPNKAKQLANQRRTYQSAIESLRREIATMEQAYTDAFTRADERQGTNDRVRALAAQHRQNRNR